MVNRRLRLVILALLIAGAATSLFGEEKAQPSISSLKAFAESAEPGKPPEKETPAPAAPSRPEVATPADLSKSLSRAEDYYRAGNFAAAREEALKVHAARAQISSADQLRLDKLLKQIEDASKTREKQILSDVDKELAKTTQATGGTDEAARTLEQYRRENEIKLQKNKAEALDHLRAGKSLLYSDRDYDGAIREFMRAKQLDPTLDEAGEMIKVARQMSGDRQAAEELRLNSWIPEAKVRQQANMQTLRNAIATGDRLYQEGKYQEALNEYRKAQTYLGLLETMTDVKAEQERLNAAIKQTQTAYQEQQQQLEQKQVAETREKLKEDLERRRTESIRERGREFDQVMELVRNKEYEKASSVVEEMLYRDPSDRSARILLQNISRESHQFSLKVYDEQHERELLKVIEDTAEKSIPYRELVNFPTRKVWREIIDVREPVSYPGTKQEYTEEEKAVMALLDKNVDVDFTDTPLPDVLAFFRDVRGVNIVLDRSSLPEDLAPVTLKMTNVPLKTALKEILTPLKMGYAVDGNVVRVASKDKLEKYEIRVYDIRDLLLNFQDRESSGQNLSLASQTTGNGRSSGLGGSSSSNSSSDNNSDQGGASENIRDRVQSLALLISQVVRPETWSRVQVFGGQSGNEGNNGGGGGGGGASQEFGFGQEQLPAEGGAAQGKGRIIVRGGNPGDIVILQTPEVHAEIEDLLRALRKAQTIQVQIDARFVTVSDEFLKDIGVNINTFGWRDDTTQNVTETTTGGGTVDIPVQRSRTMWTSPSVGAPVPVVMPDGSMGVGLGDAQPIPFMGTGTAPTDPYGMNVYFSIFDRFQLSGFFKAVQHSQQSEIVSSPRVTLTNAQRGYITVGTQTNYVASFSASGDIATPDIQTIDDTVGLDVRPIVSADRKYVYLELAPYIRTVVDIQTFEFSGQSSGNNGGGTVVTAQRIQLPVQAVQEIETTVAVPDRGILTIGGLTTLSEAQTQNGTPLLSKIPILKRIFNNDRKTRSRRNLLILVRPQIIILDEEKSRAGL